MDKICLVRIAKATKGMFPVLSFRMGAAAVLALTMAMEGCNDQSQPKQPSARPVAVARLVKTDPSHALRVTGVVEAWADADIAFEVSGRVDYIVEQGTSLEGRWVENGKVVIEGDVLAAVERLPYEAAVQAAQADVDYAKVSLESVVPAELAEADANRVRQYTEYDKIRQLYEKKSATEVELIEARAARDAAQAQVDQAKARLEAGKASLAKARAALTQAQLDLEHTRLAAPFTGEVAEVRVQAGGFVSTGEAVARLVTMDPVKVVVTVSANTHRTLRHNDTVHVYVPGHDTPLLGTVYQKSTVADSATRTFPVTIITRNQKTTDYPTDDPDVDKLPRIQDMMPATRPQLNKPGALWIEERLALNEDEDGYFVWAVEGVSLRDGVELSRPVFTLRRIPVELGQRRINYQGLYIMRKLKDAGGLKLFDAIAMGVPAGVADGDQVLLVRESWLVQPGQLVDVQFKHDTVEQGYYVPTQAIMPVTKDVAYVYVVTGFNGQAVPRKIDVTLGQSIGQLQRIESNQLDGLGSDVGVVVEGVNYIEPGEPVRIVRIQTQLP